MINEKNLALFSGIVTVLDKITYANTILGYDGEDYVGESRLELSKAQESLVTLLSLVNPTQKLDKESN